MGAHFPEIRESEAQGEVADIYRQLRGGLRLPMVNLIYRHFATIPDALPFVWSRLRTPLLDGSLDRARARLAANPDIAGAIRFDDSVLRAAVSPPERTEVLAVTQFYNRGNLTNLVGLTAIRMLLDGAAPESEALGPAVDVAPTGEAAEFPPLPRMGDLSPEVGALVTSLASHHSGAATGVTPSLYLHLSYWPRFVAALGDALTPAFADGAFARGRETTRRFAEREAETLLPAMGGLPPPRHVAAGLAPSVRLFTGAVIPEMVPIGLAIVRALRNVGPM